MGGLGTLRVLVVLRWVGAKHRRRRLLHGLFAACVLYMMLKMLRRFMRPELVRLLFKDTERNRRLLASCPSLREYSPTPWLLNGHLQTMFGAAMRKRPGTVQYTRTFVDLRDGGHVALDWADPFEPGKPTVLLLHGLTGGSDETYIQWLVHTATCRGLQCVVMNARGCGGSGLSTPRSFSAAQTEDLGVVVRHVRRQVGRSSPLFAVGYSLGAGVLVKYLGERGRRSGISAAAACCASYDMKATTRQMEQPFHKMLYNRQLTSNLRKWLKSHEATFRQASWLDLAAVYRAKTVRDFDNEAIVKQFGYKDVWEYYEDASSGRVVHNVAVPLLIANALDDPIAYGGTVPTSVVESNDKIFIALTKEGGHVAWCQGLWPVGESWENSGVVQFFEACMNDLDFIQEQPDEQPYAPLGATAAQKAAAAAAQAEPGFWGPMEGDGDGDDGEVDDGPLFF